jgi:uncharacterized membrane protein
MEHAVLIHLTAAVWALAVGGVQLATRKGTPMHRALGWSWMIGMAIVAISSFWLTGFMNVLWGYGPVHLLSLWVLFCIVYSIYSARTGNIKRHRTFAVGAFFGVVGAGLGALAPGRLVGSWVFGG